MGKVGKYHPPVEHRIQKGEVKNPRGKPKGIRDFKTILNTIGDETIEVNTANGLKIKQQRRVLMGQKLWHMAISGNTIAMGIILKYTQEENTSIDINMSDAVRESIAKIVESEDIVEVDLEEDKKDLDDNSKAEDSSKSV